jgi:uncharacterized OsmC-like protein
MSTVQQPTADNGVANEFLLQAREQLSEHREAAQFTWRATNEWVRGTHSRTTVHDFAGLGGTHQHVEPRTYDADHPVVFAAEDHGSTPVEFVLHALAACLTGGIASVAQHRGIELRSVRSTIEGDMDVAGILGIDREARNGFSGVRISFEIDADATQEELENLVAGSQRRSAVFDVLTNPTPVAVTVSGADSSR